MSKEQKSFSKQNQESTEVLSAGNIVRRVRSGLKGHPGTVWMYTFIGMGFLAGIDGGITKAFVMVVFFGPLYIWGAYSRGKENESA